MECRIIVTRASTPDGTYTATLEGSGAVASGSSIESAVVGLLREAGVVSFAGLDDGRMIYRLRAREGRPCSS